jgi:hypothetical protein
MQTTEKLTETTKQQSTSILELMYLTLAKNRGEMSFAEWLEYTSKWAREVIAEYETGQRNATLSIKSMQSSQGHDEGGCQSYQ